MGLIRFAVENPVKVAVAVILLVLFGVLSVFQVRIQLTPDVDRPVIMVRTNWTGASPQEIESEIVDRQEEKLKNVSGLQKMTSSSSANRAEVKLEFAVSVDKDTAFRDVSDKLRQVTGYPEEVDEPVMTATDARMETTIAWLMLYAEDGTDVARLKTFVENEVKPILERAEGISDVQVYGGLDREIQIEMDPYKLAARGLSFREVERALRQQNENVSAGTIAQGKHQTSYRTVGEFREITDVEETIVAYRSGGPILVRDIATVHDGFKKRFSFVRSKGRKVLALPARRETGANVIKTMANLREQIDKVNRDLLAQRGLKLDQSYDETTYIWSSIWLVVKNLFLGGFLAIIVLVLFLRSGSAVGIIAVAIPISVIGSLLVINLLDRSLNVVLLAGMAFAVGMVVDNAIVVLENIYRHRSMGKNKLAAALDGAQEVWGAVLASTLTTMAVFLPVITIQEEAGQLFKDIAIAISAAVGISLIVSILVIPPLASRFFDASRAKRQGDKPWRVAILVSSLVASINQTVGMRLLVVCGLSGMALVGSGLLMPATEYLPTGNKNLVFGMLISPPGYSIDEFQRMADVVEEGDPNDPYDGIRPVWEAELNSPEAAKIAPVTIAVGKDQSDMRIVPTPPIDNFFFVSFGGGAFMGCTSKDPNNVRPLEEVMTRAAERIPGVLTMFNQSSLFQTGGLRGGSSLDVEVRAQDLDQVVTAAQAISQRIMDLGYRYPSPTPGNFDLGRPEIRGILDRAKAADLGLDVRDLGFIVRACVDGAFVGEFNDHGDKIDMALTVVGTRGTNIEIIRNIPIYTPSGNTVLLDSAVNFIRTTAPQSIAHIEEMPSVTLSVTPKTGVALQTTMLDIEESVLVPLRQDGTIPPGVITSLAGTANKLTQTQRALLGDFRGVMHWPRLFGLSPIPSIGLILLIFLVALALARVATGKGHGLAAVGGIAVIAVLALLGTNPQLAITALQSRALLALLVTYLLMAALFESFAYPFVIMLSVPLAAVGGFIALRIVHEISLYDITSPIQQLDVLTMLGFVILIGIVVNNAILIVHQALTYMRRDGIAPAEAVALSVQTRTRPIFMSAMTSIFGMFPLVVMPGAGSELYRGLGSVVLGGLLVSTIFTLLVVPAMFTLLLDFQAWLARGTTTALDHKELPVAASGTVFHRSPDR